MNKNNIECDKKTTIDCYCSDCNSCKYNPKWYNKIIQEVIKTKLIYEVKYY